MIGIYKMNILLGEVRFSLYKQVYAFNRKAYDCIGGCDIWHEVDSVTDLINNVPLEDIFRESIFDEIV